jgi:phosphopantetheinyl transferase (holo-ACP synthase)
LWTIARSEQESFGERDLTSDERREYDELTHHSRRRDWLASRLAAKRAIAAHCTVTQDRVRLISQIQAAPISLLRNETDIWTTLPLSISISHHDGCALAAVVDSPARIGVDLARDGEIEPEHHRYFLAWSERAAAERIGATLVWALKEAAWKALSLNGATPFTALRLGIDDKGALRGLWLDACWIPATARTRRVSHDMIAAAVCVQTEIQ